MTNKIISVYRINKNNIGDYMSSPLHYFDFQDIPIEELDIQDIPSVEGKYFDDHHIILGGGGLLVDYYLQAIDIIRSARKRNKLIAWGVGQQCHKRIGTSPWWKAYSKFPYQRYLADFDIAGIRDFGHNYNLVSCASCMHPSFDKKREIKHEFVVFSHIWYPVPIEGYPSMDHDSANFDEILDFLGSGETIITSSYHGMYWGTLLNRRVLTFPTNSKFFTLKYPVTHYPAVWTKPNSFIENMRSMKTNRKRKFVCASVKGWRILTESCRTYSEALEECRYENQLMYKRILDVL